MQVKVYNQSAEETGTIELPDSMFGLKWNADLVHQVVTSLAANRRAGTAHAKTRGEVRGGGKKPWRQKGTGRARHGSIRSPIWKGGGVTHGPRNEKDYSKKINKKMAKKALFVTLSAKAKDNEIIVMDDFKFPEAKTKHAAEIFIKLAAQKDSRIKKGNGVLVALPEKDQMTRRALRNLPFVGIDEARNLNAYEVLQYKYILFPKRAIESFKL
ncbi:MAG: large subunit ribosomal protein L4 [Parcubacteria group bacterium Gr01-1014_33]|nr:MAG: large subunit ribosomal protein L4 [Parcubacteria group bacterium Gr01-1014_33]